MKGSISRVKSYPNAQFIMAVYGQQLSRSMPGMGICVHDMRWESFVSLMQGERYPKSALSVVNAVFSMIGGNWSQTEVIKIA